MRTGPDLNRSIRSWLGLGVDMLPERVLDRVLEELPTTPQRRPAWPPRRLTTMSTYARAAVIAAAVLAFGVLATRLLPAQGRQAVGQPAASQALATPAPAAPTSSPAASIVDESTPVADSLTTADIGATIAAGDYMPGEFGKGMIITLPDGFALERLTEGNAAFSSPVGYLGVFIPEAVFPDPCHVSGSPTAITTSDDLVAALTSMTGFTAGPVTESTISGRRARRFTLSNRIDTATAGCTRESMLPLFTSRGNPKGEETNGNTHQVVWVIDGKVKDGLLRNVYAGPILVITDSFGTDADLRVLEQMVESIQV